MNPQLSVIILNYRSFQDCDENLTELFKHAPHIPMEVLVIDNHSEQPAAEHAFIEKWIRNKKVMYFAEQENLGYGQGNNVGLRNAKGEYYAVMNPDIRVTEGLLDALVEYMDQHQTVGIIGPKLLYPDLRIQDSYRNFPRFPDQIIKRVDFLRKQKFLRRRVSEYLLWTKDPSKTEPVDWVVGAFLLIRKKAYQEVGGFDPRYFLFMEDVDLCRRMWRCGWQVTYMAEKHAIHKKERLSQGGILDFFRKKTVRIHFISALKYFWKWKFKKNPR